MKDRYTGGQSKRTDETNIANGKLVDYRQKMLLLYKPKWSISIWTWIEFLIKQV